MIIKFENDNYVNTANAKDYFFYNDTQGVRRLEVYFSPNNNTRIAVTPQQEQAIKKAIASGQRFLDLDNLKEDEEQKPRYFYAVAHFGGYYASSSFPTTGGHFSIEALRSHFIENCGGGNPIITFFKELTKEDYEAITSKK